jgi:hypothetical protein
MPGADDAAGGAEVAFHQEPHGHRRGVPAARGQAAEDAASRRRVVQVEGLRVELAGEGGDVVRAHREPPGGAVALARGQVFEVQLVVMVGRPPPVPFYRIPCRAQSAKASAPAAAAAKAPR